LELGATAPPPDEAIPWPPRAKGQGKQKSAWREAPSPPGQRTRSEAAFLLTVEPEQIGVLTFSDEFHQVAGSIKKPIVLSDIHLVHRHHRRKISGPFTFGEVSVAAGANDMNPFNVRLVHPVLELIDKFFLAPATKTEIQDLVTAINRLKSGPLDNVTL
jgi:hypothetical protein